MKNIDEGKTIREIVIEYPQALDVFERHRIDYCCGGNRSLREVAAESTLGLETLVREIEEVLSRDPSAPRTKDWTRESPANLVRFIEDTHHTYVKRELPRLTQMMSAVLSAHGAHHGEILHPLSRIFIELAGEIDLHLRKEEDELFPAAAVSAGRGEETIKSGTAQGQPLEKLLAGLIDDHHRVGRALDEMRELTAGFAVPDDACPTFTALYRGFEALERDLHRHIHLENNVLFPRLSSS